jgi:hypothetical protein
MAPSLLRWTQQLLLLCSQTVSVSCCNNMLMDVFGVKMSASEFQWGKRKRRDTRIFSSVLAWEFLPQPNLRTYVRGVTILDVTGNHKSNIKMYTTDELQLHGPTIGRTAHSFSCYAEWPNTGLGSSTPAATCMVQSQTNGCTAVSKYALSEPCSGCYMDVLDLWSELYTWTCIQWQ